MYFVEGISGEVGAIKSVLPDTEEVNCVTGEIVAEGWAISLLNKIEMGVVVEMLTA